MRVARSSRLRATVLRNRRKARAWKRRFNRKVFGKKVYNFSEPYEMSYGADINVAANSQGGGTLVFSLNQLANAGSYQTLFDLYKINKVTVKILPMGNVADMNAAGSSVPGVASAIPQLFIAPNRDYYVPPPSSEVDVLNDDGCKVLQLNRPRTFTIYKPRPQVVDGAGATIDYGILPNRVTQWLTTGGNAQTINQSTVKHYGFRWWINNLQNAGPIIPKVIYTLHFSMKERD